MSTKNTQSTEAAIVQLTPTAQTFILTQLKAKKTAIGIRISLKSAGCSGFKYVLDYVDQAIATDKHFVSKQAETDLHIYIDPAAVSCLFGTTIDYVRHGLNAKLQFINPNEKSSCGCGESVLF